MMTADGFYMQSRRHTLVNFRHLRLFIFQSKLPDSRNFTVTVVCDNRSSNVRQIRICFQTITFDIRVYFEILMEIRRLKCNRKNIHGVASTLIQWCFNT